MQAVVLIGAEGFSTRNGGLNRYLEELLAALLRLGAPARAIVVGRPDGKASAVIGAGRLDQRLPARVVAVLRAAVRAGADVQVIDAHFALYAALPILTTPLRHLPLVIHFQGPWADESVAAGTASKLNITGKRTIEKALYKRAREVVVLSGPFKSILTERYGVAPWRVTVLAPGVNLDRFRPGDRRAARHVLGIEVGANVGVVVRRLVARMGLDVLIEAWAGLGPGDVLLVAGEGPERATLEATAARLGISEHVHFLGRVSDEELVRCYQAADVCVVPSAALEGFGLIVLEALACGTPVVASAVGGLPEAVGRLDSSALVPPGDIDALRDRLRGAFDGSAPLSSSETCRAHAEGFSWDQVARRTVEVYERALRPPKQRKLRVVYLDHCALLSGGELALAHLLPALAGVDAHVVLAEHGPLVAVLHQAGVSCEVLPMGERARGLHRNAVRPGCFGLRTASETLAYSIRLSRRLNQLQPDVVHTNSLKAALYGGVAARLAGAPLIVHIRDRIAADYLPRAAVALVQQFLRVVRPAIIANSRTTLETLGPVQTATVVSSSIADAIPSSTVSVRLSRPRAAVQVGMVGRLAPWKGQHVFLEAFATAFPDGEAKAIIVGSALFGEEDYQAKLERLVVDLGIEDRATFAGFKQDIGAVLADLDVLVHASVIPEPFGQVVVEGMVAGLPVVAADAGGPAEILTDGVDGMLYEPGNVTALATALVHLAGDPELRLRLGTAARERALDFSPDRIAAEIMDVYRRVLGHDWPKDVPYE